jgi:DNA helicase-2/ATP-dependent DNA helicase PcrA
MSETVTANRAPVSMNDAQKEAVLHHTGPLLVLAGPGSGKTFVITRRVKALIEEYGVNPRSILVITFTRAAALEMEARFKRLADEAGLSGAGVTFSTFHSIFFHILKCAYGYTGSNILRPEQKQNFFREILTELNYEVEDEKEFSEKLQAEISLVKGEGMDPSRYYPMNCPQEVFLKAYRGYEQRLLSANLIDFDDMQLLCYELLTKRPDILAQWQKRFTYILVDEVQDTNTLQYKLTKLLAAPENNLMMVGDDDQSIYRFRGARPEIMLSFSKDFPNGRQILLNVNYRSGRQIVEMAGRLIANNTTRYPKQITASRDGEKQEVFFAAYEDSKAQNEAVLEKIKQLHDSGVAYREMAVLFRTNIQPRGMAELLMRVNVPFDMRDVFPNIYDHWICRDLRAYLTIAKGDRSRGLFLQIANKPKRYISRDCFLAEEVSFDQMRAYYEDKDYVCERIDRLENDLIMIRDMKPYAALHYLRHVVGYEDYVKDYARYRNMKPDELLALLDELEESAKPFATCEEWYEHIAHVREELSKNDAGKNRQGRDGVAMMTYHSAKGLEFRHVFLIDVNEGMTPYSKAAAPDELEEERRMFYVAFTRAKNFVYISWVKNRFGKPVEPSRYLGELMVSKKDFAPGVRVMHAAYKEGTIIELRDHRLKVQFDGQKTPRTLDLDFCVQNRILTILQG